VSELSRRLQTGDLAGAEGRALWDRLLALKDRGLYRRIGFCATIDDGPALLARRFQPDVVQLKCNLLDQRAQHTGVLAELAALEVDIHAASVFADGLLFMSGEALPLDGIPIAMKEEMPIAGESWQLGSLLLEQTYAITPGTPYRIRVLRAEQPGTDSEHGTIFLLCLRVLSLRAQHFREI
jgi:hypothetical protein